MTVCATLSKGSPAPRIFIVGDSPSKDDVYYKSPFSGFAGRLYEGLLRTAGVPLADTYWRTFFPTPLAWGEGEDLLVKRKRSPGPDHLWADPFWVSPKLQLAAQNLRDDLEKRRPTSIIALGNFSLWALTGQYGVMIWRGSQFTYTYSDGTKANLVATYEPGSVMADMALRPQVLRDFQRAAAGQIRVLEAPAYRVRVALGMPENLAIIRELHALADASPVPVLLTGDIETRSGHIACIGLAWSPTDSLCVPLACIERPEGYYTFEEEVAFAEALYDLSLHPNIVWAFHNGLYDLQYYQRWLGFVPNLAVDTMLTHHVGNAGMKKSLGFCASIYCQHYVYWKDDGKTWESKMNERQLWEYNCFDCMRTFEVATGSLQALASRGLLPQSNFQHRHFWNVLLAMHLGVRVDVAKKKALSVELLEAAVNRQDELDYIAGEPLNVKSSPAMQRFFYETLAIPAVRSRKTGNASTDSESLKKIVKKEPILGQFVQLIEEIRSLTVFHSTFVDAGLDRDQRMRSSFNMAGTETFRFSSSQNAFGSGLNFQNIPSGDEESTSAYPFPNLRKLFLPDEGYVIFDMDLDRADLQVVVWEAEDEGLKELLRRGVDLHIVNGGDLAGKNLPPYDELIESHPNYKEHKARFAKERQFAKSWVHGTNYGGSPATMAMAANISVHQSEKYQTRWFQLHPGISEWHRRTASYLHGRGYVENAFGFRRYYYDRPDALLPEALAWVPQSTIGILINKIWDSMLDAFKDDPSFLQILIQVHDSLVGQFRASHTEEELARLRAASRIVIPYSDPLVIPTGFNVSPISWGNCK